MKQIDFRTFVRTTFLVLAVFSILVSCHKGKEFFENKHPKEHRYSDNFKTTFTTTNYVYGNGNEAAPTAAEFPGEGKGSANKMPVAYVNFNQLITFATFEQQPLPVVLAFPALAVFGLPKTSVNSIVYDDKGNSIWFQGTGQGTPISATRVEFEVSNKIVGGTGKFSGASGHTIMKGYFNPQNNQEAGIASTGVIKY
jgi:hypothetical protein